MDWNNPQYQYLIIEIRSSVCWVGFFAFGWSTSYQQFVSVAVVILFFISWAPFHVQRLGYVYFRHSHVYRTVNEYLMYLSGCLYYLSVTLNPILYNLMSTKYRQAFKSVIFCSPQRNPNYLFVQTTSQIHLYLRDIFSKPRTEQAVLSRSLSINLELSTR